MCGVCAERAHKVVSTGIEGNSMAFAMIITPYIVRTTVSPAWCSTCRPDVEDATSLNILVMEMDVILRDHPDDDDGINRVSRSAFVGSVRSGLFGDLLKFGQSPAVIRVVVFRTNVAWYAVSRTASHLLSRLGCYVSNRKGGVHYCAEAWRPRFVSRR